MTTQQTPPKPSSNDSIFLLNTEAACAKMIKIGWILAVFSAVFTAIIALLIEPLMLLDTLFIGILAYFIRKKSRIASTIMVIYFIISKYYTAELTNIWIVLIYIAIYVQTMRATYIWHKKYAPHQPNDNKRDSIIQ